MTETPQPPDGRSLLIGELQQLFQAPIQFAVPGGEMKQGSAIQMLITTKKPFLSIVGSDEVYTVSGSVRLTTKNLPGLNANAPFRDVPVTFVLDYAPNEQGIYTLRASTQLTPTGMFSFADIPPGSASLSFLG